MTNNQAVVNAQTTFSKNRAFAPDIVRLLDILVRIERRRQDRLRAIRTGETRRVCQ
jgi:hypothetical protein